jgi:hypothetical protein
MKYSVTSINCFQSVLPKGFPIGIAVFKFYLGFGLRLTNNYAIGVALFYFYVNYFFFMSI